MKKEVGITILLVLLCALMAVLNVLPGDRFDNDFFSLQNLQNLTRRVGMYGIFSIGLGLVIITGGIDLSVGSMFALQGVLLAMMLRQWDWPWPLAALAAVAGPMLLGTLHGTLITRVRMQPFIVTLCGLLLYRGIARFVAGDSTQGFGSEEFGFLRQLTANVGPVPAPFLLLLAVAAVMWVALHRSVYGRYLFAAGRNEDAARYSGLNTSLVIGSSYVLSMGLAALSGILFAFDTNSISPSSHGNFYELYGIAAAVLGGCSLRGGEGSIYGIIIGTALLQVLQNLVNLLGIPSALNFTVMGAVILIGVLVDQLLTSRRQGRSEG